MSSVFSTAINGINSAVSRATQSAVNIVNASSTTKNTLKNIDEDLVKIKIAGNDVAANAFVIKTQKKIEKALLDIKV